MNYKISIPKPCSEDWNRMIPDEQGRFCSACRKSVVDFTAMSNEEVQQYLIQQADKKICGSFGPQQLQQIRINLPPHLFSLRMAGWKRFLAAAFIAFSSLLFSCTTNFTGSTANTINSHPVIGDTIIAGADTAKPVLQPQILGEIAAIPTDTPVCSKPVTPSENTIKGRVHVKPEPSKKVKTPEPDMQRTMGLIAVVEDTSDVKR